MDTLDQLASLATVPLGFAALLIGSLEALDAISRNVTTSKRGGLRFVRIGRLCLSFSIAKGR